MPSLAASLTGGYARSSPVTALTTTKGCDFLHAIPAADARPQPVTLLDPEFLLAPLFASTMGPRRGGLRLQAMVCVALAAVLMATAMVCVAWDADRMAAAAQARGPKAVAGLKALLPVLSANLSTDETARLQAINQFFNQRILFRSDTEVWGQEDYWASPLEMMGKGEGDCEDYAVAKYFSLLLTGVAESKLRLVYVRAKLGSLDGPAVAHMVLAYYPQPGAEPMILDNLISEVRPASRRPDLSPVFSFNGEGLWQGTGLQSAGDPVARLSKWRDLLSKALAEGFQP
jgi:predicted transglutaminase-like cysteine proteinase